MNHREEEDMESSGFTMKATTNVQKDLIEKYATILFEYFAIMNASAIVQSMEDRLRVVQIGLSAITNIYKLAFFSTKNVATSFGHCQKGIYCYIEYIEQAQKFGTSHTLDYLDAITFIYDKTLTDLHKSHLGGTSSSDSSVFTNILSVSQSHQARGRELEQSKLVLDQLSRVPTVLLWFQHPEFTLLDQMDIIDIHLSDFATYAFSEESLNGRITEPVFLFLETLQEKIAGITKQEYMDILTALSKHIKRGIKRGNLTAYGDVRDACLYLSAHYSGQSLHHIAAQEGWKKPTDDLVKFVYASISAASGTGR